MDTLGEAEPPARDMLESPPRSDGTRWEFARETQGRRVLKHTRGVLLVIAAAAAIGCGDQRVELGPVAAVSGLVEVTTEPSDHPPKIVAAKAVELPDRLVAELEGESSEVEVVVRVLVGPDGSAIGISVLETRPESSPAAQQYGAAVAEALWSWSYEPAHSAGSAVPSYLDVRFRYPRETPKGVAEARDP